MNPNAKLTFYHPNGRGNGSAVQFSIIPASEDREGAVLLTIARQLGNGNLAAEKPEDRKPTFDWTETATTVRLNFVEVSEILMVFGGHALSLVHAGKDGLYHNNAQSTISVAMKRSEDPARPGFLIGIGRTPKADPNGRWYHTFIFRPSEAFGLRLALQAQMGALAFGNATAAD